MLKSELYDLEKTIDSILNEERIGNLSSYRESIAKRVASVKASCLDLKKKWTHELLGSAKEQVIKRYVQYHQAGIIQLSEKVSREVPPLNISDEDKVFIRTANQEVAAHFENVLEFLRSYFYQYFDIDHRSSIYHSELLSQQVAALSPILKTVHSHIDGRLLAAVIDTVDEIISDALVSGITYRQADHCLNLVRMSHQLLFAQSVTTTEGFYRALYQQNVNSLYFFNWYRAYVSEQLAGLSEQEQRENFINNESKVLSGIYVSLEKAIQPELPTTDNYLISWLREHTHPGEEGIPGKLPAIQLPLNLSVPQFALFIRIFYKTGCFPVENVAMITRFFTEHFTTKKQPHISHKSFGRAFYNIDQSAAAVVRDFLQKMLNYLNKTYFP